MTKTAKETKTTKIEINFSYSESAKNVYKSCGYFVNDRKTTAAKKEIKELVAAGPEILTQNTYFWNPSGSSSSRRFNERRHIDNVADWLTEQGFTVLKNANNVKGVKIA